jgi:hypothetical protein
LFILGLAGGAGAFFLGLVLVGSNDDQKRFINLWVRTLGTGLACLMLLRVALRAAGRISLERERQTLDSLMATPLEGRTILRDKWLGSILSVVHGFWVLGAVWALGLLTGGLDFLAWPLLILAWLVYADFVANLGLWFSLVSRTTQRAVSWTLLVLVGLNIGPWLLSAGAHPSIAVKRLLDPPPTILWSLAYYYGDFQVGWHTPDPWEQLPFILAALACYFGAARLLGTVTNARFRCLAAGRER